MNEQNFPMQAKSGGSFGRFGIAADAYEWKTLETMHCHVYVCVFAFRVIVGLAGLSAL